MFFLSALRWVFKQFDIIQRVILISVSVLLVFGITSQVVLRYVFKSNLMGLEEITIFIAFWLYFIGGTYGASKRTHISADLTDVYIKNKIIRQVVQLFASLITIFISSIITYYSVDFFIWSLEKGATSPVLNIPMYFSQSAVFVGFTLMTIYFITHFIKDLLLFLNIDIKVDGCG